MRYAMLWKEFTQFKLARLQLHTQGAVGFIENGFRALVWPQWPILSKSDKTIETYVHSACARPLGSQKQQQ